VFYVALTTVGAPLGSYLASLVTDRFERKWCLAGFGTVIALCGLLYGLTFNPVLIVVFGFLVNMFERGYTALGYAYSPELFDTRSRSLGTGVSYGLGRLSNAAGPLIVAALYNTSGYRSVFFFIAGTWLVGAVVLAVFGPLTRGGTRSAPGTGPRAGDSPDEGPGTADGQASRSVRKTPSPS
jgi:putative MFS transporter